MIRRLPAAGFYAPVTVLIQELPGGETQVAHDTVASATVPNGDAATSHVERSAFTDHGACDDDGGWRCLLWTPGLAWCYFCGSVAYETWARDGR